MGVCNTVESNINNENETQICKILSDPDTLDAMTTMQSPMISPATSSVDSLSTTSNYQMDVDISECKLCTRNRYYKLAMQARISENYKDMIIFYENAADLGHILSKIELGCYYLCIDEKKLAEKYFKIASQECYLGNILSKYVMTSSKL